MSDWNTPQLRQEHSPRARLLSVFGAVVFPHTVEDGESQKHRSLWERRNLILSLPTWVQRAIFLYLTKQPVSHAYPRQAQQAEAIAGQAQREAYL